MVATLRKGVPLVAFLFDIGSANSPTARQVDGPDRQAGRRTAGQAASLTGEPKIKDTDRQMDR